MGLGWLIGRHFGLSGGLGGIGRNFDGLKFGGGDFGFGGDSAQDSIEIVGNSSGNIFVEGAAGTGSGFNSHFVAPGSGGTMI